MGNSSRTLFGRPDVRPKLLGQIVFCAALCFTANSAISEDFEIGGHSKFQLGYASYPSGSHFRSFAGEGTEDFAFDARLNLARRAGNWDLRSDFQFAALRGDSIHLSRSGEGHSEALFAGLPNDDRRLLDLVHVLDDEGKRGAFVRVDRLSLGYTGDRGVLRFGRQAVTWGNGLIFNTVMDLFNPFDPTAIDKEYKPGDDMLYGQYLLENGNDLQAVLVFRRDPSSGRASSNERSLAVKYHGFSELGEYDLLVARHYGENLVGIGGNRTAMGDALWRGDLVAAFTRNGRIVPSAVTSLSRSFVVGEKNVSAAIEYHYNGFGQRTNRIDPVSLHSNRDLAKRIARGEVFNHGRHYLGLSATVELAPLFQLTPSMFMNAEDRSALLQIAARVDVGEEALLLGSLNVPIGPTGTEFGGIESELSDLPLKAGPSLKVQLATYF